MVSTIVPRPIAWVVTQSAEGVVNAAPYSFFNGVGGDPPLVSVSVEGRGGGRKDTAVNIRDCGQFVVNLVSDAIAPAMVVTAIDFAPAVSEVTEARLATTAVGAGQAAAHCPEPGRVRVRAVSDRRAAARPRPW